MRAIPIELKRANEFVDNLHRHHKPVHRDKFRIGCKADDGHLCGVIQCGRPVNRNLDDGKTIEVVRCCTDGTRNACSFLHSRMAQIARIMGYERIITYILESESGTSLRASGWEYEALTAGGSWNCLSRPRETESPQCRKQRWVKRLVP